MRISSRVLNSVRTFPKYTEFLAFYPEVERRSVFPVCCGIHNFEKPGSSAQPGTGVKK
jgi:hypothetical protein